MSSVDRSRQLRQRDWFRVAVLAAVTIAVLAAASGCSAPGSAQNARVTAAQQTAISSYYVSKIWRAEGGTGKVGCPAFVLGAAPGRQDLRVYAVVHCTSVTGHCEVGADYTVGVAAELSGTSVVGMQLDDAPDSQGQNAEAKIYPPSLRAAALGDITLDGPAVLRTLASRAVGCPNGVRS